MAEPVDMIVPMLREMRAENLAEHERTRAILAAIDKRLGSVEEAQRGFRHVLTADTLMSKLLTGEFEQRIEALERKVGELMEGHT
jgi:hypothetical protein